MGILDTRLTFECRVNIEQNLCIQIYISGSGTNFPLQEIMLPFLKRSDIGIQVILLSTQT